MKNLLILGAVRSGKTTVAKKLIKLGGFNYVSMDVLAGVISESLPETGIKDDGTVDDSKFNSFIFSYMKEFLSSSYTTVFEGCRISPQAAFDNIDLNKYKIVVFGYPNLTPEQVLSNIRNGEKLDDWTSNFDDQEMLEQLKEQVENSITFQQDCKKLGIEFIDTSSEREKKLDDFVNNISKFLS